MSALWILQYTTCITRLAQGRGPGAATAHALQQSFGLTRDEHLHNRGYPVKAIDATFSSINWNQRQKILDLKMPAEGTDDTFFAAYTWNGSATGKREPLAHRAANTGGRAGVTKHISAGAIFADRSALSMGCILLR